MKRRNRIQCNACKDIIESFSVHDFKWCKCHKVAVDGGDAYHKRCADEQADYTEMP